MCKKNSKVLIHLTLKNYIITGVLVGFDEFFNVTLKDAIKETNNEKIPMGKLLVKGENIAMICTNE